MKYFFVWFVVFNMFWEVMVCRPMGLYIYLSVFNFFFSIFRFMGKGSIGSWQCVHIERTLLQNNSSRYPASSVWSVWIWSKFVYFSFYFYDFVLAANIEWCAKGNEFPSKVYCRFTILFMISDQHAICGHIPNPTMIIINIFDIIVQIHEKLSIENREFFLSIDDFAEFGMKCRFMASLKCINQQPTFDGGVYIIFNFKWCIKFSLMNNVDVSYWSKGKGLWFMLQTLQTYICIQIFHLIDSIRNIRTLKVKILAWLNCVNIFPLLERKS